MPARYDQHFLIDDSVAEAIVAAAGIAAGAFVLEIGPGRGALTGRLLSAGARLTAVEVDKRLAAGLRDRFPGDRLTVLAEDFLAVDLSALPRFSRVVSNLPYSVGSAILRRLLDWPAWDEAVLMLQKEVVERIVAGPGSRAYGLLSLAAALKVEAAPLMEVPPRCFSPKPAVDSAVLRLRRREAARLPEGLPEREFFSLARAAFSQKRKMAAKGIAAGLGLRRAEVDAALLACGIDPRARAETIPLEAFAALALRLRRGASS